MTILSTSLVLALQAVTTVRRTADAALEARRAAALLAHLMTSSRPAKGEWSGASGGLTWRLAIQGIQEPAARDVCRREATARSDRSGRRYALSTLEPCPIEGRG